MKRWENDHQRWENDHFEEWEKGLVGKRPDTVLKNQVCTQPNKGTGHLSKVTSHLGTKLRF